MNWSADTLFDRCQLTMYNMDAQYKTLGTLRYQDGELRRGRHCKTGTSPVVAAKKKILKIVYFCVGRRHRNFRFVTAMTSFKDARNLLLENCNDGIVDDDEFILLYEGKFLKNPEFPHEDYERFVLDAMDDTECKAEFRFRKNEIPRLAEALDIPATFPAPGIEGLCLVLRRLTYLCRYSDLIPLFGRPVPELSMIYNVVLDYIYNTHGHRISQWNHTILDPVSLERYAEAVYDEGAALDNCIGFIDGTVRPICRPGELQRVVYNGHKRVHALKFQSFILPNGMIANRSGPVGKSVVHNRPQ